MAAAWIVEAVGVFEDRHFSLPAGFPGMPPDQFGFDGLDERLDSRIVIAISLSTHRDFEAVLSQDFLIIMRAILQPAICMMDAAFGRLPERDGHLQRTDRQITFSSGCSRPNR